MAEWIKILRHIHLGLNSNEERNFQYFALVAIDLVWLARNAAVHKAKSSNPIRLAS